MTLAAVMYAKDLDRLVAFYSALGLTVDEAQRGDYAVLTAPQVELSIVQIPEPIASQIEIANPPQARSRTPIKLAFVVPSIDRALEAARARGGRVDDGAKRWQFRGHAIQDAVDPEGNQYQLREPLSVSQAPSAS
jgi:predicted enzyme related to lactoylglutathione lyase